MGGKEIQDAARDVLGLVSGQPDPTTAAAVAGSSLAADAMGSALEKWVCALFVGRCMLVLHAHLCMVCKTRARSVVYPR